MSEIKESEFTVYVNPDYDYLRGVGFNGNTIKEMKESAKKHIQDERKINNASGNTEYELLGKKFTLANDVADVALTTAGNDTRFPEFDVKSIPELYKAALEWSFEEELNGEKISKNSWDKLEKLMIPELKAHGWPTIEKDLSINGTNQLTPKNEKKLLTRYAYYIIERIIDIEIF